MVFARTHWQNGAGKSTLIDIIIGNKAIDLVKSLMKIV